MRVFLLVLSMCVAAGGLSACGKERVVATLPPGARIDSYTQQAASKIDVLWVIDNSGSMAPRQENLAKNFQAFINEFAAQKIDYRIGVTTTDTFKEKGAFVGNPKVITPMTGNPAASFANNVRVGIAGSPYEVGMEAARMAIELNKATNAQTIQTCKSKCTASKPTCPSDCDTKTELPFLRNDAYLYIVFVTDEDDKSSQDVRYFYRYFETAKGLGNDGMVTTAAIMGDTPSNRCGATPGSKYKALSELTGGEVGSICDDNFSETLKKLATNAVGLKRKFTLQEKPNVSTIEVRVKYPCNVADSFLMACSAVDRTACEGNTPASINLVCTARQSTTNGWSYEEANNNIYFAADAVPALNALIEIQYFEEGKGP